MSTRIGDDLRFYGGEMPERVAIAWRGYLAALLEWSVIGVPDHDDLWRLLPDIQDDPVDDIMLGRGDACDDRPAHAPGEG